MRSSTADRRTRQLDLSSIIVIAPSNICTSYLRYSYRNMAEFTQKAKSRIDFLLSRHLAYIKKISADTTSFEFVVSQHLRMSGIYWGLCAISLLGVDVNEEMNGGAIVDWVLQCRDSSGGSVKLYIIALSFLMLSIGI